MTTAETIKTIPDVYPSLRYRDADAAIAWLQKAFGFREVNAYKDGDGRIVHADMAIGNGAIMFGSAGDSDDEAMGRPGASQVYIRVDDVKSHYNRATAAGAEIVRDFQTVDYDPAGTYSARDPEGNVWHFGGYGVDVTAPE